MPKESNNTGPTGLFEEHPRPGLKGELLGDCKLVGTTGGANRWQVCCMEGKKSRVCAPWFFPTCIAPGQLSRCIR